MINTADIPADHEYFMRHCIALATIARQRGESPVGSIVVRDKQIISTGIEGVKSHADITFHAEIEAVRNAVTFLGSQDLSQCVMYTTHEPCIMCSYVLRHTRISTIVIGILTEGTGGFSSQYALLTDTSIKKWAGPPGIITGILEKECRALHDQ